MDLILPTVGGILAIIGGFYLIHADRVSRKPTESEKGRTPFYVERGGGNFDNWNWTIPFVRIAAYESLVVISCATHQIVFRPGDVTRIETERHFFTNGLRLHHRRTDIPANILLWPRNRDKLRAALESSLGLMGASSATATA